MAFAHGMSLLHPFTPPPPMLILECSMSIGFKVNPSVVAPDESVGVTVAIGRDPSCSIKAMYVEIRQETTWHAQGYTESNNKTLASVMVPGVEIDSTLPVAVAGKRLEAASPAAAMADAEPQALQSLLLAGAGTRHELFVPDTSLGTMQTGIIDVRHWVAVRLRTSVFAKSPEALAPLFVQRPPAAGLRRGESVLGSMPAKLGCHAPAVEVNRKGKPEPLSVPQSKVKVENTNETVLPAFGGNV